LPPRRPGGIEEWAALVLEEKGGKPSTISRPKGFSIGAFGGEEEK